MHDGNQAETGERNDSLSSKAPAFEITGGKTGEISDSVAKSSNSAQNPRFFFQEQVITGEKQGSLSRNPHGYWVSLRCHVQICRIIKESEGIVPQRVRRLPSQAPGPSRTVVAEHQQLTQIHEDQWIHHRFSGNVGRIQTAHAIEKVDGKFLSNQENLR